MNIDFETLNLSVDFQKETVPDWFIGLTEFAYQICSMRSLESRVTEHFVISLPDITGGLTALSIGSLAAEITRIVELSSFKKVEVDELSEGMRVSIDSGTSGLQKVTGEITNLLLNDRTPKVRIGSRWIAVKLIQNIYLLPPELGNPQIFERVATSSDEPANFINDLTSTSIPIHRALLDIRAINSICDEEFNWVFSTKDDSKEYSAKSIIRPINSKQPGSGWSLVLNSSESEELAQMSFRTTLTRTELDAQVTILCSGSAVLAQIDNVDSQVCFSVFGRDDRQLAATELAIRQKYEYSQPLSRKIDFNTLQSAMELIAFEVPQSV